MDVYPFFFIVFFGFVIFSIIKVAKSNKNKYNDFNERYKYVSTTTVNTLSTNVQNTIPNFNAETFKHYAEMVYSEYLSSINKRNTESIKPFLSENFFKTHKNYIDSLIDSGRNVHIENVSINDVVISNYSSQNDNEILEVHTKSIVNQYETNDMGQILNGYRARTIVRNEILYFQRNTNHLFKGDSYKCPNCMGVLKNPDQPCEYCGTIIKKDSNNNDWLLVDTKIQKNSNPYQSIRYN